MALTFGENLTDISDLLIPVCVLTYMTLLGFLIFLEK